MKSSSAKLLLYVFGLALLIRLVYVSVALDIDPILRKDELYADARSYDLIAQNLVTGAGFTLDSANPTSFRAPLYPFSLAMIYWIFGHHLAVVRAIQAVFGALTCVIVCKIARMLSTKKVGVFAGLGMTFHPMLTYMTAWLYTETVFIFLLALTILFALYAVEQKRLITSLLLGLFLGLNILAKPGALAFSFAILLWLLLTLTGSIGIRLKHVLLTAMFMAIAVAPWTLRNYWVHGHFVLVSTNSGANLYGGNKPNANGGFTPGSPYVLEGLSEYESDKELQRRGLEWIRNHSPEFMKLLPKKFIKFCSPLELGTSGRFPTRLFLPVNVLYAIFLGIAAYGGILSLHRRGFWLLHLLIFSFAGTTLIYFGGTRFALPVAPALIMFAAVGVESLTRRLSPALQGTMVLPKRKQE